MNEISRAVMAKRPATITTYDARPIAIMSAPYHRRADLAAAVNRAARRGEIRPLSARPAYNERTGLWELEVLRLRDPAPAWIRPAAIAVGILAGLGALLGLGWWVLVTVSMGPLLAFLLAAGIALAAIMRAGRPQTVNITQNVRVR